MKKILYVCIGVMVVSASGWLLFSSADDKAPSVNPPPIAVNVNPSGVNPLAASIVVSDSRAHSVSAILRAKDNPDEDLTFFSSTSSSSLQVDVWGLYEDHQNVVDVYLHDETGTPYTQERFEIQIPEINNQAWISKIDGAEYLDVSPHFVLLGTEMFDQQGNLRWQYSGSDGQAVYPLSGGHFAITSSYRGAAGEEGTRLVEIDSVGRVVRRYVVPNGVHHEVVEKEPHGNLLVASSHAFGVDAQDLVVELDRKTGEVVRSWDLRQYFDEDRLRWQSRDIYDWAHTNSIEYVQSDDTLLLSLKLQNIVTKIGYTDRELKWVLSPPYGWSDEQLPFLLEPTNFVTTEHPEQDWTYIQHTASVLPNGHLMVYDNGAGRPGFTDSPYYHGGEVPGGYVRVVTFEIDDENMKVRKVWEWTDRPDQGSNSRGSAYEVDENHVLVGHGEFGSIVLLRLNDLEPVKTYEVENPPDSSYIGFYRAWPIKIPLLNN